jgi:hypothetical protein
MKESLLLDDNVRYVNLTKQSKGAFCEFWHEHARELQVEVVGSAYEGQQLRLFHRSKRSGDSSFLIHLLL